MAETVIKKVKRSDFATFLNVGTVAAPKWARMGKGITSQSVSYNPTTTSETYINEDNASTSVDGYALSINTPQTCYAGEPVFEYVDGLRRARAIGSAAETEILLVYIYKGQSASSNAWDYEAERCKCTIAIEEFGGDGGGSTSLTYTVHLNGDPEIGKATIGSGDVTFTAGVSATTT